MKKLLSVVIVFSLVLSLLSLATVTAETSYVASFKSSDAFSTTSYAGPWYYYMQKTNNNALSRMHGVNNLNIGSDLALSDAKSMPFRTGLYTVDPDSVGGAFPVGVTNDAEKYNFGYVGATVMAPEERWNWTSYTYSIQVMKAFEVPYDCEAVISAGAGILKGMASRSNKDAGDRRVRIMKNNPSTEASNVALNKIWPTDKEYEQINGFDTLSFQDIDISLKKGDMLFFVVDNNLTRFNDDVYWDPIVNIKSFTALETLIDNNFNSNTVPSNAVHTQNFTFADGKATTNGTDCQMTFGGASWGEYQVDIDVVAHTAGSLTWKIRRQDVNNNYNFAISNTGSLNFRKQIGGTSTTVPRGDFAINAFPYAGNTVAYELTGLTAPYHLTVYAKDNLVRMYVNQILVVSYHDVDQSYPTGPIQIGTYGAGIGGVSFDNLKISASRVEPTVSEITFTDGADNAITDSLTGITSLKATSTIVNNFDEPSRYMMIVAVYDASNQMLGIKCGAPNGTSNSEVVWTSKLGETYNVSMSYDISAIENAAYAKAYLWYNLNVITPQQVSAIVPNTYNQ